jgi:glycine cleavage system H protein
MAFRSVATQAVTLLRLRGIPTVSNNSSSITNTTTNTLRNLWVPLARKFATAVEDAEEVLDGLHYAASHEWVKVEGSTAIVGISDHAQKELGDLVFVELPEAGSPCKQGEKFASVESVKAVSDVYSPISGTVVEVNTSLSESPDLVSKHTSTLGSLKEIGISIPDKSRFQEWEHLLQSRKSKHHHLLELPKESTTLLNCERNNQSLAHLQKKASLAQSQQKKESLVWFQKKELLAQLQKEKSE